MEVHGVGDKVTISIRPRDIQSFVPEPEEEARPAQKSGNKVHK